MCPTSRNGIHRERTPPAARAHACEYRSEDERDHEGDETLTPRSFFVSPARSPWFRESWSSFSLWVAYVAAYVFGLLFTVLVWWFPCLPFCLLFLFLQLVFRSSSSLFSFLYCPLSTGLKRPFSHPSFYATKLQKIFELCKFYSRKSALFSPQNAVLWV